MTDLAAAVTAAAEEMRKRSTHTRETLKEALPQEAIDRIAALETAVADLSQSLIDAAASDARLAERIVELNNKLHAHQHESIIEKVAAA